MNAKAETSEDLQGRRKRLHVGMCKLVREDIALQAEQTLREEVNRTVHNMSFLLFLHTVERMA